MTTEERFWIKVKKTKKCWYFKPAIGKTYGRFSVNDKDCYAHRYSYELAKGKIPDGLTLDHLCKVTWCVNPDHLEAVTQKVNVLRSDSVCAKLARRKRCSRGHKFSKIIFHKGKGSYRHCSKCQNLRFRNSPKLYRKTQKFKDKNKFTLRERYHRLHPNARHYKKTLSDIKNKIKENYE